MKGLREYIKFIVSLILPQVAGGIGALFTRETVGTWYAALEKPSFNPPPWIFAPVWISLYILMGLSAFVVWRRGWDKPGVKTALGIFSVQLVVNSLWSWMFFGRESILGGLIILGVLWILILSTIVKFLKVSRLAGLLLIPYFLWVTFAGVLNTSLYFLNR
jgi:translocator protein